MSDYKKYYSWRWEIKHLLKLVPAEIIGAFVFGGLIQRKEKTYYVVLPLTLGDSIRALSYLAEFKRQKKISHVTVICTPDYVKRLCGYYPCTVDEVLCKKRWKLRALRGFVSSHIGEYLSVLNLNRVTFDFFTCNISMRTMWDNPSITFPMYAKAILYKISMSSKPEMPQIPEVDLSDFISKYDLIKGRTVFLNPVANSVHCDAEELLEVTATELMAKGYRVITLTAGEGKPSIPGTKAIPCNLDEAFSLVKYGGTLIGVRSGFLDVLAYAKCKIISILDEGNGLEAFFRIEDLGVNPDCHTVIYNGDNGVALQKILEIMKNEERQ